jgi:hypothetical protein
LGDVLAVEVVEGVGGRASSGLIHQVDEGALVGGEADPAGPDLRVLDRPGKIRLG